MALIEYLDKVALENDPEVAAVNKVTDDDMNEIKNVVNENFTNEITIGDTEPTSESCKIWIDTDEIDGASSEIEVGSNEPTNPGCKLWIDPAEVKNAGSELHVGKNAPDNDYQRVWFAIGKNLLNKDIFYNSYLNNGVITNSPQSALFNYIGVIPNTTYTFSSSSSIRYLAIYEFNDTKNYLTMKLGENVSNYSFTTGNNTKYIRIDINKDASVVMTQSVINELTPQLEKNTSATTYEAYIKPDIVVEGQEIYNKDNLETYSTTEQRIGTWIDGKPLYRKVVNVTMPNNEIKQTAHNIQNIDVITNIKGITKSIDGIVFIPINTANTGDNSYALQTWADKTYISVRSGVDYTMQTGFVILEYTKTTN